MSPGAPARRTRTSAGLLPIHDGPDGLLVFIAHLGGPLWARKDARAWSIVKGEFDPAVESPAAAAAREWVEETGTPVPDGEWIDLGTVRQSGGKTVQGYAVPAPLDLALVTSSPVTMEWPPRSGRSLTFPEIDRAQWCDLATARVRLIAAQVAFLDRLPAR
ncbi:MAG: NUDIX domain-containing protein [Tetrasphaera sp.]|nr:NUDIX domain-containing protein [Tetrasphaera sp.]